MNREILREILSEILSSTTVFFLVNEKRKTAIQVMEFIEGGELCKVVVHIKHPLKDLAFKMYNMNIYYGSIVLLSSLNDTMGIVSFIEIMGRSEIEKLMVSKDFVLSETTGELTDFILNP